MVLVFSTPANKSPHIKREVERAVHLGKPIVPFRIDKAEPSGALEYHLATVHWLDALNPPIERDLATLFKAVTALMEVDQPSHSSPPFSGVADQRRFSDVRARTSFSLGRLAGRGLVVALLAIVFAGKTVLAATAILWTIASTAGLRREFDT